MWDIISRLLPAKTPSHNSITNMALKHLPKSTPILITKRSTSCFRLSYLPESWKNAIIIMISKPRKDHLAALLDSMKRRLEHPAATANIHYESKTIRRWQYPCDNYRICRRQHPCDDTFLSLFFININLIVIIVIYNERITKFEKKWNFKTFRNFK